MPVFIPAATPMTKKLGNELLVREILKRADEKSDGRLSKQELKEAFRQMGGSSLPNWRRWRMYRQPFGDDEVNEEDLSTLIDYHLVGIEKRAMREALEEKHVKDGRLVEEERPAKVEGETEKERHSEDKRVEEEEQPVKAKAEEEETKEGQSRIEGEVTAKEERPSEELETSARVARVEAEAVEEKEKDARIEGEGEEKERWGARAERMMEEITQSLAKIVVEVERHARAKREGEEERRIREGREVEKEKRESAERETKKEEEEKARAKRIEEIEKGETLYKAICSDNWNKAKELLGENPSDVLLATKFTSSGKNALHVAALFGHVSIVEEIVRLVSPQFLENTDDFGNTPILIATITGIIQVAECQVNKNIGILGIPNKTNELPVTLAFLNGHHEMGRYLYSKTPSEYIHPEKAPPLRGALLLHYCLQTQCFDIALKLLQHCPELLFVSSDKDGWKPIYHIATMNSAIPNRKLGFWKRFIIHCIKSNTSPGQGCLPIQQDTSERTPENITRSAVASIVARGHRLLQSVITSTNNLIGMKEMRKLKLLHAQADEIVDLVCKNVCRRGNQVSVIAEALFRAAEEGNVKFVLKMSKANPDLLLIGDNSYQNIFCYAVRNRQDKVFNLIHGLRFKDVVLASKDIDGNTLLHVAATQAPPLVLNRIYGPTLQMHRELQWFKKVESLIPRTIRGVRNNDGKTAEQLFKEEHHNLMKQGEKWVKATATACSVVGTLIVTIMFTVSFTLPGGTDQTFGFPLLNKKPFFKVFMFSTIISLVSSSTSVLTFLAILTSHFSKETFLESLPSKLILGISSLVISIVSMMIAFLSSVNLLFIHSNFSWGLLPIIILASIPIFLLVEQLSLLRHSFHSLSATYSSIFGKKVEKWP